MAAKRFTNGVIAAALRKHNGVVPRAAEELKTARQTLHSRIARSPKLQSVQIEIIDEMKDAARGAIAASIRRGDMVTVRWFAERKMKDEGYGTHSATSTDNAAVIDKIAAAIACAGIEACRAVAAALATDM